MTKRNGGKMRAIKNHPAAAGAAIGVGLAVATAKILSDKKTRNKVFSAITDVKDELLASMENNQAEPSSLGKVGGKSKRKRNTHSAKKATKKKNSDRI